MGLYRTDYVLRQYCGACPEGYDVLLDGVEIGYTRLRHGYFRVEYTLGGVEEIVYTAEPEGDGIFESHEREYYLNAAVAALDARHHNPPETRPEPESETPVGWTYGEGSE